MRQLFDRGPRVPPEVSQRAGLPRRDKVLAGAVTDEGTWLLGTRDALVLVPTAGRPVRIAWECVEAADWDRDAGRLRLSEVGEFGQPRPVHVFTVPEPGTLLPMVRERVSASVLLQRRVVVRGRSALRVVARRAPSGRGPTSWSYELDPGVDPNDPAVQRAAADGLRAAEEELGEAHRGQ
jgi:hypothetical protein